MSGYTTMYSQTPGPEAKRVARCLESFESFEMDASEEKHEKDERVVEEPVTPAFGPCPEVVPGVLMSASKEDAPQSTRYAGCTNKSLP